MKRIVIVLAEGSYGCRFFFRRKNTEATPIISFSLFGGGRGLSSGILSPAGKTQRPQFRYPFAGPTLIKNEDISDQSAISVVMIGAGRLASHLSDRLTEVGCIIPQVYNRSEKPGRDLADRLGARYTGTIREIDPQAEICIFSLSDDALLPVLAELGQRKQVLLHTAGSVPMDVFRDYADRYGVLYPFQSFSPGRRPAWDDIPVCVEGNSPQVLSQVSELAARISSRVIRMDSGQRRSLHLAGVVASNFSNHMMVAAYRIARSRGMDPGLLAPLIKETIDKALRLGPANTQTGPAARGDQATIDEHIALLKDQPELQKLYTFVSESIRDLNKDTDPPVD